MGYYLPAYQVVWPDRWEPATSQEPPPADTYGLWWRRRQKTLPLPDLSLPKDARFLIITEPDLTVRT